MGHATVKKHIRNGNEGIRTAGDMGHATVKKTFAMATRA